jgi:enoyl-CoA hydratase/carnithine racemase
VNRIFNSTCAEGVKLAGDGTIEVGREGAVAVLTLRREAKLNAISSALEEKLLEALAGEEVTSARCVVFAGGERAFSAGADVTEFRDVTPERVAEYYADSGAVYERIADLPQPTISAISGWCLGAGLELALATDFRVADETARFGLPEVDLGIIPSSGGTHRLVRLVGAGRAKELILLRERIDAAEALRLGLVTEVAPAGAALERARELASRFVDLPPLAVTIAKQTIDAFAESPRATAVLLERVSYGMLSQTDAAQAAAHDFADKHKRAK